MIQLAIANTKKDDGAMPAATSLTEKLNRFFSVPYGLKFHLIIDENNDRKYIWTLLSSQFIEKGSDSFFWLATLC